MSDLKPTFRRLFLKRLVVYACVLFVLFTLGSLAEFGPDYLKTSNYLIGILEFCVVALVGSAIVSVAELRRLQIDAEKQSKK